MDATLEAETRIQAVMASYGVTPAQLEETKRALRLDRTHVFLELERLHRTRRYCWHHDPQGWVAAAAAAAAAAAGDAEFDAAMEELEWAKGVARAMEREASA